MSEQTRTRLGIAAIAAGTVVFFIGIMAAHFTGLPEENSLGQEIYPSIPRGWIPVTLSQLVALGGSQIFLAGVVVAWLWDRPMTWARASVGALVFSLEVIIVLGIIPNEWLALTQGTFEWTSQKKAFDIPRWLVLNNDVSVSFGAIKDAVSGGYSAGVLGAILVATYQYQERRKRAGAPKPQPVSDYGRPLVRGGS